MCIFPKKVKYIFGTKHLRKVKTLKKTPCFEQGSLFSSLYELYMCIIIFRVFVPNVFYLHLYGLWGKKLLITFSELSNLEAKNLLTFSLYINIKPSTKYLVLNKHTFPFLLLQQRGLRKQLIFCDATTCEITSGEPNDSKNSTLTTFTTQIWVVLLIGWSKFPSVARPIRSTTLIWAVIRHQYGISAPVSHTSFREETRPVVEFRNVGCFLRLPSLCSFFLL